MTMGALSLTGCSVAPTTDGSAPPSQAGHASSPAAAASSAAATPESSAPESGAAAETPASPAEAASGEAAPEAATAAAAAAPGTAPAAGAGAGAAGVEPVSAGTAQAATAAGPTPAVAAAAPDPVAPAVNQAAAASTGDGPQAAAALGWGPVVAGDEFSNTGAPDSTKWSVFKGTGHAGKGVRSPAAWSVANGVATVSGDAAGTTGGMSAKFAQQKYGKWETRMKTNARDPQYHPVMILWPNNNTSPNCAEVDYAEGGADTTTMKFFLHYACGGSNFQTAAAKPIDSTQWHNYAVEWTPAGITGYIDGVKTFTDTNPAHLPTVGMHQTLQLDWFPSGPAPKPSQMQVDWVRVYK
ncbi:glycoside hydrolase family 16 protein [Pseudarthrobacter sp. S9]|uniref:glycoside hydrolase family 16 protein n=1 Tax=Pseudarthrobacter sp. S9 TaxID=3418421 RepID=UPI003D032F9E